MTYRIVLDPGHGGDDPGAVGHGLVEKVLTLMLAKHVRARLKAYHSAQVFMTREEDQTVSLADRVALAERVKADFFYSIHINAAENTSARGYEDYIHTSLADDTPTAIIRRKLHESLLAALKAYPIVDRGMKKADYYVLRKTRVPAVLTENLFLTHPEDALLLKDEHFLESLAEAHVQALSYALSLKERGTSQSGEIPDAPKEEGTPILGESKIDRSAAEHWAKARGGTHTFIDLADLYWTLTGMHGYVRPEVAYAQAAKETAFGRFGGVLDASYMNPAGLKSRPGGRDTDPSAHHRFKSWEEGVRAHLDHLALYAGAKGYPRQDTFDPRHFPELLGRAKTIEGLGGLWAPDADYGRSIVRDYLLPLLAEQAPVLWKDVSPTHWAYEAIRFVHDNGLMQGYPDGTFRPHHPVTRAELAQVIFTLSQSFRVSSKSSNI
ncbi:MAG: N-acetylmuramoyl-L-alanine amidase [Candidatus Carbobacillus sp.]|nr:N-acetylmuramoyl-L-alanine amidase [Candidatus Carbobacillus sp.]